MMLTIRRGRFYPRDYDDDIDGYNDDNTFNKQNNYNNNDDDNDDYEEFTF